MATINWSTRLDTRLFSLTFLAMLFLGGCVTVECKDCSTCDNGAGGVCEKNTVTTTNVTSPSGAPNKCALNSKTCKSPGVDCDPNKYCRDTHVATGTPGVVTCGCTCKL